MTTRVPRCPKCKEPAIPVKRDFFRCSCGFVWEEHGWQERIEMEEAMLKALEAAAGINALISMGHINCDKCGREICHGEKYCLNTKERITAVIDSHKEERGTRYCKDCSLKAGYLKMVRNVKTGHVEAVKYPWVNEVEI